MAYRIKRKEGLTQAVRRAAIEQIDAAVTAADHGDQAAAVHEVRRRCKRLRGLLRLVRPAFEGFERELADFRETARLLGGARDAAVRLATFDKLAELAELDIAIRQRVRAKLAGEDRQAGDHDAAVGQALTFARLRLLAARGRAAGWTLDAEGFDALRGGLKRTYRHCRDNLHEIGYDTDADTLHAWRGHVKSHGFHCRLLRNVWLAELTARGRETEKLGELLGDDHDLALLVGPMRQAGAEGELFEALDRRRARLQREAAALGARLFAEKPGLFTRRLQAYWETWRDASRRRRIRKTAAVEASPRNP